ncbi:ferrous iron transport protein B [Limisalsivibrio acetivorans]|uniref:ferrous iron transport protein B n=1 Tax=Limisalsivibrio acetivorans TaxID=1304888 RepID=UPI0003B52577|nr:ferrous iron transport protein B [Limisalsivibrio acetivorans]
MRTIKAALAGNPNAGKTTLFNAVAGTRYHVANYPGVTVEKKEATISQEDCQIILTDLPGTYSLTAYSLEEVVARDFITIDSPDVVVDVLDASNLERNLYLAVQLLELGAPIIFALNMVDMLEKRNITIDDKKLSEAFGAPVVRTVAKDGTGKKELLEAIMQSSNTGVRKDFEISYGPDLDPAIDDMVALIKENSFFTDLYPARWTAVKYLEEDEKVLERGAAIPEVHEKLKEITAKVEKHLKTTLNTYPEVVIADYRYGFVNAALRDVIKRDNNTFDRVEVSDKVDRVLTHRLFGPIIMLGIIYGIYKFTFTASEYPVGWLETIFGWMGDFFTRVLPDGLLQSLIVSGIIDGVGGVLGFTPLILFMFFVIAILEDSGYMSRIAYMLDRVFRSFGMQGSSVVPYIVSGGIAGGCAVPGVMAARTIKGDKERLLTILTAPFMPCGAKIPVYALLIGAFYPGDKGLAMLGITLLSWLLALISAFVLSKTVVKGENSAFVMELPPYRFPTLRGLLIHAWERTWMYIKKAGTFILAISILLWALMTFPGLPEDKVQEYETRAAAAQTEEAQTEVYREMSREELKGTVAGTIGSSLEPVTKYAGFDWKTNIALIGGIAAKEVIVSTLGTAHSLGEVDMEESTSLSQKLKNDPDWTGANALALVVFVMLYAPCFITIIAIRKETGSWGWPAFTLVSYTVIAYVGAVAVYSVFS